VAKRIPITEAEIKEIRQKINHCAEMFIHTLDPNREYTVDHLARILWRFTYPYRPPGFHDSLYTTLRVRFFYWLSRSILPRYFHPIPNGGVFYRRKTHWRLKTS
jgi:hypothetical protein